jgi:hypothetical protein
MSASLDRKIYSWVCATFWSIPEYVSLLFQDMAGKLRDDWSGVPIRVTDMAVTPDMTRLVTVGMDYVAMPLTTADASGVSREPTPPPTSNGNGVAVNGGRQTENRMIIYDLKSKAIEL